MSERTPHPRVADQRKRLRRLERLTARRRQQVELMRAQIGVLSDLVRSGLERTVGGSADPETAPGVPCYTLAARLHRRGNTSKYYTREGIREPILHLYAKLPAQRWAAMHGVRVPEVFGRWPDPDAIDWDSLPDRCVVKSNVGGGSVNVFPLVRDPATGGYTDLLTGEPTTAAEVTQQLWSRHRDKSSYFAEELLVGRRADPGTVPDDIKVFCFYGEPLYLEVRRGTQARASAVPPEAWSFAADGTELPCARPLMDHGEEGAGRPHDLEAVVEAAARLSAAIRRPLERLDFFETDDGVIFGEVTQNPGHIPALVPEWDRRLGEAYERAYARLLRDLAAEGALHVDFGTAASDAPD